MPFYFKRVDDKAVNLAGIYAITKDKKVTFTILTKEATPLFGKTHNTKNRRPVILKDDDLENWLANALTEDDVMSLIQNDLIDSELKTHPVSKDLYKRNGEDNRPVIHEELVYKELEIVY